MKNNSNSKNKKITSILQIGILIVALFAFTWMLGQEFEEVSGLGSSCPAGSECKTGTSSCPTGYQPSVDSEGLIIHCGANQICCEKGNNPSPTKKANGEVCTLNSNCLSNYCDKVCKNKPSDPASSGGGSKGGEIDFLTNQFTNYIMDKAITTIFGKTGLNSDKSRQITGASDQIPRGEIMIGDGKGGASGINNKNLPKDAIDRFFAGKGEFGTFKQVLSSFVHSVLYCGAVAGAAYFIFQKWSSERNQDYMMDFIWAGLAVGVALGTVLGSLNSISSSWGGIYGAIATAAIILGGFLMGYQNYAQDTFSYNPTSWNPASGGKNCEKCNNLKYGCSEYQCHAFGKACNITNVGTTDEKCVWINPGDISGPEITPMNSVLELGYSYKPINTIAPPDKGVKIVYTGTGKDENLCIPPFTDLVLGVSTNEVAVCKIDIVKKANISDMASYMDQGNLITQNHTVFLPSSAIPSDSAINETNNETNSSYELNAGKTHDFYIRCEDVNGNPSPYNFLMQFCVQPGPDTMAPIIKGTNYLNTTNFISYNSQSAYLQVYTNEPADCKWDFQDVTYDSMAHNMSKCSQKLGNFLISSMLTYGCETNLTGMKNYEGNDYYIKCKDQPWLKDDSKRNKNKVSYKLTLMGTYDLAIENVTVNSKPNNTIIKDSANQTKVTIGVTGSGGAEEGKVKCQYKFGNNYLNFYNEGSLDYLIENKQSLWLEKGKYNYEIKCFDIAGNTAFTSVGFTIEQDVSSPTIVRAYSEEGKIKLITNEEAVCVYSITSCNYNFDDGVEMETTDSASHFIDWTTETDLFVKCKDMFGNRPLQDKCSIIVRGSEF